VVGVRYCCKGWKNATFEKKIEFFRVAADPEDSLITKGGKM
jgi:hypothetical protein